MLKLVVDVDADFADQDDNQLVAEIALLDYYFSFVVNPLVQLIADVG